MNPNTMRATGTPKPIPIFAPVDSPPDPGPEFAASEVELIPAPLAVALAESLADELPVADCIEARLEIANDNAEDKLVVARVEEGVVEGVVVESIEEEELAPELLPPQPATVGILPLAPTAPQYATAKVRTPGDPVRKDLVRTQ
jgi:hypothetical protein